MEQLESEVKEKEAEFISTIQIILSESCSDRIKIAKLYYSYIECMAKINAIVAETKLQP